MFVCLFFPLESFGEREVSVGVYPNKPKIFFDGEEPRGLFIDLLEHVAKVEAWRLKYVPGTWAQCLARLKSGRIDLLPNVGYTESRRQTFDFTDTTILVNWAVVYVPEKSGIETVLDLEAMTVAVVNDHVSADDFRKQVRRFGVTCRFIEVLDFQSAAGMVHAGTADAAVISRLYGPQVEREHKVRQTAILCSPVELRFAAPKGKHTDLLRALDQQVAMLKKDKKSIYYRSLATWISPLETGAWPTWMRGAILAAVVILCLLGAAMVLFRVQVRRRTAELRQAQQRFQGIFDMTFSFLGLLTPDGVILELNQTALRFSGLAREDVVGRFFWDLPWWDRPAEGHQRVKAAVAQAAAGEFVRYEAEARGAKHEIETLDFSIKPVTHADGKVVLLIPEARRITAIKRARQKLLAYQSELRELAAKLTLVEQEERHRLAQDLHDSVIQSLSLSRIKLGAMGGFTREEEARQLLDDLRQMMDKTLTQLRTLTFELSPPILYELGLAAALEWLGEQSEKDGVQFDFENRAGAIAVDETVSVLLFQSVRELLANVRKHARASRVGMIMETRGETMVITIRDNGVGFDPKVLARSAVEAHSFGLLSIRERMRHIGGTLELRSAPGTGTSGILTAPMRLRSG